MLTRNKLIRHRYLVKWRLGGSDSSVFEAFDLQARASVALKQTADGAIVDAVSSRESFERGARALWQLRHPNLPTILRHFVEGTSGFLVMELVPGDNLATVLARSSDPFPVDQVLRWADQLLDALDYVHTLQPPLIHGDINPSSIKLTPGTHVVLLGFGVAPRARQSATAGASGRSTGFVSPEQTVGAAPDERSDLFALAATLYYLSTGSLPAPVAERVQALSDGKSDPLAPPRKLNSQIPAALSVALMAALALEPAVRPASAAAMRAAIKTNALTERRWLPPAVFGVAAAVLLIILGVWARIFGGTPTAQRPTPQRATSAVVVATGLPTIQPEPGATTPPTAPVAEPQATRSLTPAPPPALSPTARPAPQVASIEPQQAYTGTLPLLVIIHGTALEQVKEARLIAEGRAPIDTAIRSGGVDMLMLSIAALPEPLDGVVSYRIELNGIPSETPAILLRDFLERKQVQGVLPEYAYTNRVALEGAAAYTGLRAEPTLDSPEVGQLRNGDQVEVLRADVAGWYAVRVRAGGAGPAGGSGWVERWLVDNREAPATPVPQPAVFAGRVYSAPIDRAVKCGTSFESSIYGGVEDSAGVGIRGARLRITSADGRNSFTVTTGRGGVYSAPGLGCTTWTVRLLSVPNAPNGISANTVTVRNLNGGRYTAAEVRFKLQQAGR